LQAHDRTDPSLARSNALEEAAPTAIPTRIRVEYHRPDAPAPSGVLAAVCFGQPSRVSLAPLEIDVQLAVLQGASTAELWYANGPVHTGRAGIVRYAHDDHFLFAAIEEDERSHGGICSTAEIAYAAIQRFQQQSDFPHLLRMWNYLDAINEGAGDMERYRQFCVGRARALADGKNMIYPAATAIGRQGSTHRLQVFWLAGRHPGAAVENPRQVSAYHYPRVHGPVSPSFSRATLVGDGTVLVSGTASIVGHVSQHHDDALEQLEETLRNLHALTAHTGASPAASSPQRELLKVYVRDPALVEPIAARLRQSHPHSEAIFLAADVCRRELLVEIEIVRVAAARR
jgi:chorismate lyase / 3-hydroxybenzoate synthase